MSKLAIKADKKYATPIIQLNANSSITILFLFRYDRDLFIIYTLALLLFMLILNYLNVYYVKNIRNINLLLNLVRSYI